MNYRVQGLSPDLFEAWFDLTEDELAARGAVRRTADEPDSFPCRVSLEDADPGEELILLPYRHHATDSPYQASGPIYVRRSARAAYDQVNRIPPMQLRRLCSVRAYDRAGFLVESDVVPGQELEARIRRFFEDSRVDYVHVHNARPGCFAFRVVRA
jgi:uncharacterized protein DUF1203